MEWGCCNTFGDVLDEKSIKCYLCSKLYHHACVSLSKSPDKSAVPWKCPACLICSSKAAKKDSTPIRNISTSRGSKRAAIGPPSPSQRSPSPPSTLRPQDKDELQRLIQDTIKTELNNILVKFNKTTESTISKELQAVKKDMQEIVESISFINDRFEVFEKNIHSTTALVKKLESENAELKNTVNDLTMRITNLEQQSRFNNLEVQCVPEKKNENVYEIVTKIGQVVNCKIEEKDILRCTRVAKANPSSNRPRTIVVQLSSPRLRDQFLASTLKYNRNNSKEKLNSEHLGFVGHKTPVYIAEHLSPANKALHAACRIKAREKNYKYVWIRNGRIFVRKTDGAQSILINSSNSLSKII